MRTPLGYVGLLIRCLLFLSLAALLVSIGGFITSQVHNAVSISMPSADDSAAAFREYGEVPIPGTQTVHLPAGQVAITFHAVTVGIPEAGLPVPDLKLDIDPPAGVADPQVTENMGGTTSFNNDAWRRVWIAQITKEGDYQSPPTGRSPRSSAPGWRSATSTSARPARPARPAQTDPWHGSPGLRSLSRW